MTDYIYELSNYDSMYDCSFYWNFSINDTSVARVKRFMREQLRYDGYSVDNGRGNMQALHLLKGAKDIQELTEILNVVGYTLKEVKLL